MFDISTELGCTENRKMMDCFSTECLVQNLCMRNVICCESHFSVTSVNKVPRLLHRMFLNVNKTTDVHCINRTGLYRE